MNSPKHTPGPWGYKPRISRPGFWFGPLDSPLGVVGSADDAALLGAAPDLLAAAKDALSTFELFSYDPEDEDDPEARLIKKLADAIAKAEGAA